MNDTVHQIKEKLDIVDVISPYTELHRAGKQFKGKSPFASEKTPSFYVSPDQGLYYCFSTNQGGDMFTFIQTIEGVDFKEALKMLAEKAGVEITQESPQSKSKRDRHLTLLDEAAGFFCQAFKVESGAQEYLRDRGVTEDTISSWQIGYAPGPPNHGWREAREFLVEQGYSDEELLAVGIVKTAGSSKAPYDVFRDRIMFPMRTASGRVVAFSGRILHKSEEAPKYVNSPETEYYKKSELLFGYDKAKEGIRKLDFSIIVEGQFDVVMCHQAGFKNTIAVSGTALTALHVRQLERLSSNVLLALDADRAGLNAMKKSAELMLPKGMDVKVLSIPEGEDPADLIKTDVKKFKSLVGNAKHVIEFLIEKVKEEETDERKIKLRTYKEIVPLLALIPNKIDQEYFIEKVAKIIDTTSDAIRFEVNESIKKNVSRTTNNRDEESGAATTLNATARGTDRKKEMMAYLIAASSVLGKEGMPIRETLEMISNQSELELKTDIPAEELSHHVFTFSNYLEREPIKMVLDDLKHKLNLLEIDMLKDNIKLQRELLKEAEVEGNTERYEAIFVKLQTLQSRLSSERTFEQLYAADELDKA